MGRDDELAALRELLTVPGRLAVVALHGVRGVGKTQLARRYAAAVNRPLTWQVRSASRATAVADLAALAVPLDLPADSDPERTAQVVVDTLLDRPGWLLIFDDATRRDYITDLVPLAGDGQVVITSPYAVWDGMATGWELTPMSEAAATALLRPVDGDAAAAAALAKELGGIPLALAQAAAYCRRRPSRLADYRTTYHQQPALSLSAEAADHPEPVVRTWVLNSHVAATDPAAIQLLRFLAFLAPLDVPRDFLTESAEVLPRQLRRVVKDPDRLGQTIAYLAEMQLLSAEADSVRVLRFGQEAVHGQLSGSRAGFAARLRPSADRTAHWSPSQWAGCVVRALTRAFAVDDGHTIGQWELCTAVLPHARAVLDRATAPPALLVELGEVMANFFTDHGDFTEAVALYAEALDTRIRVWGSDHPNTLVRRNDLAIAMTYQGDFAGARTHLEEVLAGNRRKLGSDHPNTINAVNNLASALSGLGAHAAARQLGEEAYETSRRVRGPEDPETLTNLHNFGVFTLAAGDVAAARTLHEQSQAGFRRVLGPEHPHTLGSLRHLAEVHRAAGDLATARQLHQHAFDGRRRTLGATHPDTLVSIQRLASVAELGGDGQTAAKLYWELGGALARTWPSTARSLVTVIVAAATGSTGARTGFDAFAEGTADGDPALARFADALRQVIEDRTAEAGDGLPADQRRVISSVIRELSTDG